MERCRVDSGTKFGAVLKRNRVSNTKGEEERRRKNAGKPLPHLPHLDPEIGAKKSANLAPSQSEEFPVRIPSSKKPNVLNYEVGTRHRKVDCISSRG